MQAAVILDELLERGLNPELARIEGDSVVLRWELSAYCANRMVGINEVQMMYHYSTENPRAQRSAFRVVGLPQPIGPHTRRFSGISDEGGDCPCDRAVPLQWDAWYVADFKRYGAELRLPGLWPAQRVSYIHADTKKDPLDIGAGAVRFISVACPNCLHNPDEVIERRPR